MYLKDYFLHLFDYHVWANEQLIQHLKTLPSELLLQQVSSVFPTIAHTIGHILAADETWFSRMESKPYHSSSIKVESISKIEDAEKISFNLYSELRNYLLHTNLEDQIDYKNTKGQQYRNSKYEILQHLVNHGTYHRGNIAAMIRQMGHEGIATDYIKYVRN